MKYFGISLIVIGVFLVFYAVFFAVGIFVQEKQPPEVFQEQEVSLIDMMPTGVEEDTVVAMGGEATIEDVFPISKMLNLVAASMFAMLLIFGGSKLTEMGIRLMKSV